MTRLRSRVASIYCFANSRSIVGTVAVRIVVKSVDFDFSWESFHVDRRP